MRQCNVRFTIVFPVVEELILLEHLEVLIKEVSFRIDIRGLGYYSHI